MNALQKFLIAAIAVLPLVSCKNSEVWDPSAQEKEIQKETEEVNTFDYKTTASVKTSITYTSFPNDVKGSVYFEVYDEYPFESEEAFADLKSDLEPVFTGYTSADGTFSEEIILPAYMAKAYIYTPNPLVTSLMTADVVNGAFSVTDAATTKAATRASSSATRADEEYYSKAVKEDGWKALLIGDNYDKKNGKLNSNVIYQNGNLKLDKSDHEHILATFNSYKEDVDRGDIPYNFGREEDMEFLEDAELAITLIQSNTWWTSTLGYYYYDEDETAPASYNDLKSRAIVIVPNTLSYDTGRDWDPTAYSGMDENTTVQLKYFGKYANGEYTNEIGTTIFPKGTHIGFVLYSNGWTNRAHPGDRATRSATSIKCCEYYTSEWYHYDEGKPLTAVLGIGNFVVISFEDDNLGERGRYADCIVTTKSNPINALNVDRVKETVNTSSENIGVYAFEDLWPNAGDYDMNDVVINLSRTRSDKVNHVEKTYEYVSETFDVTTYRNYATLDNHYALRIMGVASSLSDDKIKVTKDGEAVQATITKEGNDYIVQMESIDISKDHKYSVSLMWNKTFTDQESFNNVYNEKTKVQVFANRPSEKWEVHIPYEAPTSTMDMSLFGTKDDKTDQTKTPVNWYTRASEYPFAFFLEGATYNDISPLLDRSNEGTPINEIYPLFESWAASNGKDNTDWYKNTKK